MEKVESSLKEILVAKEIQCGNYRDLSLFGAKEYEKEALDRGLSLNKIGE